jgi:hypothetical protein
MLVTLVLGAAIPVDFVGEQHVGGSECRKIGLRFRKHFIAGFHAQAGTAIDDHQCVATGNAVTLARF